MPVQGCYVYSHLATNYLEYDGCNVKLYFNSKEGKRLNGSREIGLNNQIVKEVYYERKWDHKKLIFLKKLIFFGHLA